MPNPDQQQFSSRWFRVYDEVIFDPKIQTLSDKLHRFWFELLCLASKNKGFLPQVADISWVTRRNQKTVAAMIATLYERGLLEREGVTFTPHNWQARQYISDTSTDRVRKHREKVKADGNVPETFQKRRETVTETAPDTETEQSRAEGEQSVSPPARKPPTELRPKEPPVPDLDRRYRALYDRHIIPGFKQDGEYAYAEIVSNSVNPATVADSIDARHAEWMAFFAANPDEYRPGIGKWLHEGYFTRSPVAAKARDSPGGKRRLSTQEAMLERAAELLREEDQRENRGVSR